MKKYLIGVLAIIFCLLLVGCGSKKITLEEIVEQINKNETVKTYKELGYKVEISAEDNKLTMITEMGEFKSKVIFKLDGNILSNEKLSV